MNRRCRVRRRAQRNKPRPLAEVLTPMLALARRRGDRPLIRSLEMLLARWESRE
ncbi:MAG: hypothetical protein KKA73_18720 [Chloroflexi bacterium]|nr:hypothetical protein [Chloroflexota bacterium]MBU1749722.1 hypothetical protein [Chloroflexota bacterium]